MANNTTVNAKINEVKNEIPNITSLATTTVLTSVENKTSNVSNLVKKKTAYQINISQIENKITTDHDHDKYITTEKFTKLTSNSFTARHKQEIGNFVNKTDFDNKLKNITSNKKKSTELSEKVKAISTKRLTKNLINRFSILYGTRYFPSGIFKNYLIFIPSNTLYILTALLGLIRENLMECQKKILTILKI